MQREHIPDVSVIIAVYNAMPYLVECLDSVVNQSIGIERIEVIAVDDGSTDGSGAELDRYAARHPQMRVVHQANSGGASAPRNRALDMARGRYVYVVDADDYLGPEALGRLVGMADSQDSDVVLGKQVGLGRVVSDKAYRHAERADLYTSEVYRSLRSFKLIRRAVLEYNRIRYPEDLWYGEDQVFMTAAYLAARKISVVGDYDCYFLRKREDGGNITSRPRTAWENVESIDRTMRMVSDAVRDPVGRRRMLGRHFRALMQRMTAAARARASRPDYAAEVYWRCKAMCEAYWTSDMYGELPHIDRIRMYCFLYGAMEAFEQLAAYNPEKAPPGQIVDNGRVYRPFPLFRDPAVGLPDGLFEITDTLKVVHRLDSLAWKGNRMRLTGRGYITSLGAGRMTTELALRQRETGVEYLVPVTACPSSDSVGGPAGPTGFEVVTDPASVDGEPILSGFEVEVDLASVGGEPILSGFEVEVDLASVGGGPIPTGTWDLFLNVRTDGVMRPARLGRHAAPGLDRTARRPRVVHQDPASGTELAATVFFTAGYDNVSIEVTRRLPLPLPATVPAPAG
ncbi:glycosyltransferase [Streptomyces sp. ISL-43]|uniref:glycosyltransferase family 2 protein n=1 Tax=Streptomyces sp. ISL-43 TaxID=2819183 RepID=UPI001BEAEE88|nr:glycosyltransferase [Streptomyces sp. ISL-43]MBT2448547.1 glycosyltransferase [Streptomyces sp. ISL-43]